MPCQGGRWAFLLGLQIVAVLQVTAVDIYTSEKVEALNGTDTRLKCTFGTSEPIGQSLTVTWNFKPESGGPEEFVFYYHGQAYPPQLGRFKNRAIWDGDVSRSDASIIIRDLQFSDNGTFTCRVINPPDVHGRVGEIQLQVVKHVTFSEIHLLAVVVGGACALIIVLVVVVILVRRCRRKRQESSTPISVLECKEKEPLNEKPLDPAAVTT
ncbi:myelin protein zero-like protein 2 [Rhinatrema bivittatum]|uniref:myelin protein zero-like protein 2 n=1 Tax=Rhinatrema bivittatum TaxID=194408 RepID=UPI00112D364C|nr:myelin protein zero-like protein 2 [Rhinatrema bivittatum]